MYYALQEDGTVAQVADGLTADLWDIANRRIGLDRVGNLEVSTVFLVIDHSHGRSGPPVLFETMVFDVGDGGSRFDEQFCDRYTSKAAAEAGHARVVAALQAGTDLSELDDES